MITGSTASDNLHTYTTQQSLQLSRHLVHSSNGCEFQPVRLEITFMVQPLVISATCSNKSDGFRAPLITLFRFMNILITIDFLRKWKMETCPYETTE